MLPTAPNAMRTITNKLNGMLKSSKPMVNGPRVPARASSQMPTRSAMMMIAMVKQPACPAIAA